MFSLEFGSMKIEDVKYWYNIGEEEEEERERTWSICI